jgi:glycerophosphoryl diester phosphodiesterase
MKNHYKKTIMPLMLFFAALFVFACVPPVYTPTENVTIDACLSDPDCTQKLTVAHRGTGSLSYYGPENTLAAYEIAWKMGADSVEIDVRSTKDGELVIMHDETVNRTTYGQGKVSDLTLTQIKALKIRSTSREILAQQVPTLREVMALMKGKTMVYVDIKTPDIVKLVGIIQEEDMIDSAYLLIGSVAEGYAARSQNAFISLLPAIQTKEQAEEYIDTLSPIIMFEMLYDDATPEVVDFIHSKGIKIHMDALGEYDILGKCGYKIMLDRGVDSIQSDRIDLLVPYLRGL